MQKYLSILFLVTILLFSSCSHPSHQPTLPQEQKNAPLALTATPPPSQQQDNPFTLAAGDEINITVWRNEDLTRSVKVDPTGSIQYPLLGELAVSGLTLAELRTEMTQKLAKFIIDPHVDIAIVNLKHQLIYVLGEIKNPGTFEWHTQMPVWEGIAKGGGFTVDANTKNILLIRKEGATATVNTVNLDGLLVDGSAAPTTYLHNGDVLYVLPSFIANVQRFMNRLTAIITPIINIESGILLYPQVQDVLEGNTTSGTIVVPR